MDTASALQLTRQSTRAIASCNFAATATVSVATAASQHIRPCTTSTRRDMQINHDDDYFRAMLLCSNTSQDGHSNNSVEQRCFLAVAATSVSSFPLAGQASIRDEPRLQSTRIVVCESGSPKDQ